MLGESVWVHTSVQSAQREPAPERRTGGGRVLQGAHVDLPPDRGHRVSWPGGTSHRGSLQCPAYIRCKWTVYQCLIQCINAWYIWYCKCIAFCCVLYDGFFVRFSNCSLIKYIALICQACFCSNLKKCIKIQKCSQLNLHIYMLNRTCLQYMKRQCMHDNKFLLCLKIVYYVYLHDF